MTPALPNPFISDEPTAAPERMIEPNMQALFAAIRDEDDLAPFDLDGEQ